MAERDDEPPKQRRSRVSRADPVLGDSSPKARASRLKTEVVPPSMLGRLRDQLVSGASSGEDPWSVSTPSNQGERPAEEGAAEEASSTTSSGIQETGSIEPPPGQSTHRSSNVSQRRDTLDYQREELSNFDSASTSAAETPPAKLYDSEDDEPYPQPLGALSERSRNPSSIVPPWERERKRTPTVSANSGVEEKRKDRQKKESVSKSRDNGPKGEPHAQGGRRPERTVPRKNSPIAAKRSSRTLVLIPVGLIGGCMLYFLLKGLFLTNTEEPITTSPKPSAVVAQKLQLLPGSIFEPVATPLAFPNLPSGLYSGIARGFLPDSDVSLTFISQDNGARVGVILGIEGWQSALATPSADQSLTISSNGWLLKFFIKKASDDIMVGRWENRFTKEVGEWKVVPMR